MNHRKITFDTIKNERIQLIKAVETETLPFYMRKLYSVPVLSILVISEAAALLASVISVSSDLSPAFILPIVLVYSLFFPIFGYFFGKQVGNLYIEKIAICEGSADIKSKSIWVVRIKGIVAALVVVIIPFVNTALLRFVTRVAATGSISNSEPGTSPVQEATDVDNVLALTLICIPLLVFFLESAIEIAAELFVANRATRKKKRKLSDKTVHRIQDLIFTVSAITNAMPDNETDLRALIEEDNHKYIAATELLNSIAKVTSSEIAIEFAKGATADQLSIIEEKMK